MFKWCWPSPMRTPTAVSPGAISSLLASELFSYFWSAISNWTKSSKSLEIRAALRCARTRWSWPTNSKSKWPMSYSRGGFRSMTVLTLVRASVGKLFTRGRCSSRTWKHACIALLGSLLRKSICFWESMSWSRAMMPLISLSLKTTFTMYASPWPPQESWTRHSPTWNLTSLRLVKEKLVAKPTWSPSKTSVKS